MLLLYAVCCLCISIINAEITVLGQVPLGQATSGSVTLTASGTTTADNSATTTLAAYDSTVLDPPPIPSPPPNNQFTLELTQIASNVQNLSIKQAGAFWGFSIEMSVVTQVLGRNSTHLNVPFLNLMSNIVERAGSVHIRIGGNTQERAELVQEIPDASGRSLGKEQIDSQATTKTPAVTFVMDFFYMMSNITSLVNGVGWYLGMPFNQTDPFRFDIAEQGEAILGDSLLGLQAGNEPDFYATNGIRTSSYTQYDYFGEFQDLITAMDANSNLPKKNNLIAPSVSGVDPNSGQWTPEMVFDTGFLTSYADRLTSLSVEHYPDNNCAAEFGGDLTAKIPQIIFSDYLNHTSGQIICSFYLDATNIAQGAGKPFLMFETNTASCGGFAGISDSFGASLWALDYGLQMAYSNFSGAMLHVGGQNNYYNPFTAPPTNESTFNQWTIGAIYYSTLVAAEVFGNSGNAQIVDLQGNDASIYTPQYAIYDNGQLDKVALFNYITDPTGATAYTATIHLNDGTVPTEVYVKYLLSDSVSTKTNITWAGQTFGTLFTVDGRLRGDLDIQTVACDQSANTCSINVPAPAFALVFFSSASRDEASPTAVETYSTTAFTKVQNTATINSSVLATSNGHSGKDRAKMGSTSKASSGARRGVAAAGAVVVLGMLIPFLR